MAFKALMLAWLLGAFALLLAAMLGFEGMVESDSILARGILDRPWLALLMLGAGCAGSLVAMWTQDD